MSRKKSGMFHVKRLWFALVSLVGFIVTPDVYASDDMDEHTHPGSNVVWRLRICITDFTGKDAGWFDVKVYAKKGTVMLPNGIESPYSFRADIFSDTRLPFWLFAGKSKTREVEYLDSQYTTVYSELEIVTPKEKIQAISWTEDSRTGKKMHVRVTNDKGKYREKTFDLHQRTLTAANIPFLAQSAIAQIGKPIECYMVNKAKPEMRKVTFTAGTFDGRPEALQYAGESQVDLVKILVDLHVIGGTAVFYIDREVNLYYGEGVGVKVISMRSDAQQ